ncbi:hypothetical protein L6R52_35010, partial [Myxococcota bacterium]|nr:hypothetical protein [Myxococcota bacterium]
RALLGTRDGTWFLAGKDHLAPRRRRFAHHSAALWPEARRIAAILEKSGLASAGLVTGSLATDNADEHADIDFLLVYRPERTWTSYALVRLLGHAPGLGLGKMCANYVLSEAHLEVRPHNLFTALELAKAVPMFGFEVYRALVRANGWARRYLPNALPDIAPFDAAPDPQGEPKLVRAVTESRLFQALEALEKQRKHAAERRDVGVDMQAREARGSMDRHSPTRSFHALSELRYRMEKLGLDEHPLFPELSESTRFLGAEMSRWGGEVIAPQAEDSDEDVRATG